jgi:hypothetical protein
MPKTIMVAKTAIDDAISTFNQLPAKTPSEYTLREAIRQILPAIKELITKGYNLAEIVNLLDQKNITISTTTLKQYIRDFDKSQSPPSPPSPSKQPKQSKVKAEAVPVAEKGQEKSTPPTPPKNTGAAKEVAKEVVVASAVATETPYKSPPKPGSEQFNN